jgi:hypothetical protein
MAQDSEVPKAADKGKGKAVDDAKKDKQQTNGKKEDEKIESRDPAVLRSNVVLTRVQPLRKSSMRKINNSRTSST